MYSDKQRVQMYINLLFDWQWMLSFINLNNNTPDQFKLTEWKNNALFVIIISIIMSVKGNGLQQNWFIKRSFSNCWFYIFIIFLKQKTLFNYLTNNECCLLSI
jgi:hypothetical protein